MQNAPGLALGSVPGGNRLGEIGLKTYVGALAAFALALAASWAYRYGLEPDPKMVVGTAVFAVLILLSNVFPVHVSERWTIGAWDIGLLLAVALLGPVWAALAAVPSGIFVGRKNWLRIAYEVCQATVAVFLAGIVFSLVSEPLLASRPEASASVLYGTFASGVVLLGANHSINAVLLKVKYGQGLGQTWRDLVEPYLLSDAANVLTAGLGVLTLLAYGPMAAVVAVGGAIGSQALVYRSRERSHENRELRARVASLEEALTTSNTAFGAMVIEDLGRRDGYTHRHAAATAVYAYDVACELKLDEARARRLRMAGLLHNVGMFGLPEDLLTATGRLNSIAQGRLAEHPEHGERVLAAVPEFEEMARWVRWHHERPDGRGYPDKLRGPWIPLEAKVLAVAQAYASEILDKPNRPGVPPTKARERLSGGAETEFDGVVVRAFLRLLDTESEGYRMADDHRFAFPTHRVADQHRDSAREEPGR